MSHMTFAIIVFGTVFFIAYGLAFLILVYAVRKECREYRAKRNKTKLDKSSNKAASNRA